MIEEPSWLLLETVPALHEIVLRQHGGLVGVRAMGLLEPALARPRHHFPYESNDVFVLAAAYAVGITQDHPFDGNKRTAFLSAYTFLGDNGWRLRAGEVEVVRQMVALAEKAVDQDRFAQWLRENSSRR